MWSVLNPDTEFFDNYIDKGRFRLAWRLSVFFSVVFFTLSFITVFTNLTTFVFYFIVFLLSIGTLITNHLTKRYRFTYWVFTVTASLLVTISMNLITSTLHYSDFLWILCIILFSFIGLDKKIALFFLGFHVLSIGNFIFFQINGHFETLEPRSTFQLITIFIEISFTLLVMAYLINEHLKFQKYAENELKNANKQLKEQFELIDSKNQENKVLIKEVHHRVKNNLQIVISLLRIQSDELKSPETKRHFSEAINRIMSISLVHQKLYQEKEIANIKIKDYIEELFSEIAHYSEMNQQVQLKIDTNVQRTGLKTIIPLGLLINELITNSFKHAFDSKKGSIDITIKADDPDQIFLHYSDSGIWKEGAKNGFGMELLNVLTLQLDGTMKRNNSKYEFHLKNLDD